MINLKNVLEIDGLSFNSLNKYCRIAYRMNTNPLPPLRRYLNRNNINIPVHYIENNGFQHREDILNRVCGREVPLITASTIKREGYCWKVDLRLITVGEHIVDTDGRINYI